MTVQEQIEAFDRSIDEQLLVAALARRKRQYDVALAAVREADLLLEAAKTLRGGE